MTMYNTKNRERHYLFHDTYSNSPYGPYSH